MNSRFTKFNVPPSAAELRRQIHDLVEQADNWHRDDVSGKDHEGLEEHLLLGIAKFAGEIAAQAADTRELVEEIRMNIVREPFAVKAIGD